MAADADISFITPYWSGSRMMDVHLTSIRRFHPSASILISKRGGAPGEMDDFRRRFGIRYWLEECNYVDALLRLLDRCDTKFVCIMDHDTVLLASIQPLVAGISAGEWQLVGIEERIREAPDLDWPSLAPDLHGWLRLRPGYMDATFLLLNWREFRDRWGLRGVRAEPKAGEWLREFHYGICERLHRHKYLLPYHVARYGAGNLIRDGETDILWHQWYGSYRQRFSGREAEPSLAGSESISERASAGERAFLADYPDVDFSDAVPAWGPAEDVNAARAAISYGTAEARRLKRRRTWRAHGAAALARRSVARMRRWWLLKSRGASRAGRSVKP